jgi:hypothetical protein
MAQLAILMRALAAVPFGMPVRKTSHSDGLDLPIRTGKAKPGRVPDPGRTVLS